MPKIICYTLELLVILFLSVSQSAAQKHSMISGIVRDAESQQKISHCSIRTLNTDRGTTTDGLGKFSLGIPQDQMGKKLEVSSVGYITDTIALSETQNYYVISLKPIQAILSEIVVTGVSKASLAKENPIPIVAVSTKMIDQSVENNIIDALVKNVPGLTAVKTGPNISKPFIRGLGYNRVLTLYDGIRQEGQQWGDEHSIEVDAYTVEKGEVIKGPASLMYGSDALAGVVSLFPAMPLYTNNRIKGKYFSEYQTNNGLVGNGIWLAHANSHWVYVVRGAYRIAKNYKNSIDGRVYNTSFRETNVAATIRYTSNRGYSDLNLTLYNNLQGIPDGSRDSISRKFTKQVYEGHFDNVKNRPGISAAELNSYQLSALHQHIQHHRVYSKSHYQFGKGDADILVAFQQNIRREYNHPTAPRQAGMFVQLNTWNYSFRYTMPCFLNTEITAGINGMYQKNKNKHATDFTIPDHRLLDAGSFLFAKWKQNNWTVSGGIRYDVRHLNGDDFYTGTDIITSFNKQLLPPDTANAYLQFPAFNKTFTGTSLSIGATYALSNQISLKTNIARGYRAPNITEFASNGLDPGAHIIYLGNRTFKPEFSLQEDIGAEIHYKNIAASISFFNNHIQNYIYLALLTDGNGLPVVNAQGNKTYQYQQASAQLYGMEASIILKPALLRGFCLESSFSGIYGYNRMHLYKEKSLQGEYLPLIPPAKLLSSIAREFTFQSAVFSSITLKAEADMNATQNRYLALNNTETKTKGFTLYNLSVNASVCCSKNKMAQLQLQVNNVLNKAYQSHLSRLKYFEYYSASPTENLGMFNMGRNACIKLILPF